MGLTDVTVCIASFGDRSWFDLGSQRAAASAFAQGCPVVYVHGLTLHDARNAALAQVTTEFVIHLDADDELAPDYVERMLTGTADLRAPAVQFIFNDRPRPPFVPKVAGHTHECDAECITSGDGNWLVIGTMARAELLRGAGGWRAWDCYEDFCLWMRVLQRGATVEAIPSALYIAHARRDSRNRAPSIEAKNAVHAAIVAANRPAGVAA